MVFHTVKLPYNADQLIEQLEALLNQEMSLDWFKQWGDIGSKFNDLYVRTEFRFDTNSHDKHADEQLQKLSGEQQPMFERVWQKLVARAITYTTDDPRLTRIIERLKNEHEVTSPELLESERKERELVTRFKRIVSQQVLSHDDPRTLARARHDMNTTEDDMERKNLWTAIESRVMKDTEEINRLFLELVPLRKSQAEQQSFPNYASYVWKVKQRVDYKPEDSLRLLAYVHDYFDGAEKKFKEFKAKKLGLPKLKPWNKHVSFNQGSTRMLSENDYLVVTQKIFESLSPTFSHIIENMIQKGHLDIMNRLGKTPRNYVMILTETDEPVSVMNCTGSPEHFSTIFHELGHAIHHAHIGPGKLYFEKSGPKEVNEFFALTFQILGGQKLLEIGFLTPIEQRAYKLSMVHSILTEFEFIRAVEQFQHWVYTVDKPLTSQLLDENYLTFAHDPYVDWTGYEHILGKKWQSSSIVSSPFYSIEYVISWLAALIFVNKLSHQPDLIHQFAHALTLGNTKTAKETFEVMGIQFPFTKEGVRMAHESFEELFMPILE